MLRVLSSSVIIVGLLLDGGCFVSFTVAEGGEEPAEGEGEGEPAEGEGEGEGETGEGEGEGEEGEGEDPIAEGEGEDLPPDLITVFPEGPVPIGNYVVQLTWEEGDGDLDLHVAPIETPCDSFERDIDDVAGFGPENIAVGGFSDDTWLAWVSMHRAPARGSARATVSLYSRDDDALVARLERTLIPGELWAPISLRGDAGLLHVELSETPASLSTCITAEACSGAVVTPSRGRVGSASTIALAAAAPGTSMLVPPRDAALATLTDHGDGTASLLPLRSGVVDVLVLQPGAGDRLTTCSVRVDVQPRLSFVVLAGDETPNIHVTSDDGGWCSEADCYGDRCLDGFVVAGNVVRQSSSTTVVLDHALVDGRLFVGIDGQNAGTGVRVLSAGQLQASVQASSSSLLPLVAIDIVDGVAVFAANVADIDVDDVCAVQP